MTTWQTVSGLHPETRSFRLRDWSSHLSNVSKISRILSMQRLPLKKLPNLNLSVVLFFRNWPTSFTIKAIWKIKKESFHKHFHFMPETNSIYFIRKYIRMYVWLPLPPPLSVSLVAKRITGCGPVTPVISPCSVFMRMLTENRQNTAQTILLWKQKNICLSRSKVWKKEIMQWLWDSPEVQAVIWPYRK